MDEPNKELNSLPPHNNDPTTPLNPKEQGLNSNDPIHSLPSNSSFPSSSHLNTPTPSLAKGLPTGMSSAETDPINSTTSKPPLKRLLIFTVTMVVIVIGTCVALILAIHNKAPLKNQQTKTAVTQPTKPAPPKVPPATYKDPKGYLSLQYPGDWVVQVSKLTLESIGGDTWLESFNLVPADQAHIIASSPDYNSFIEGNIVQGPAGDHIVAEEQAGGEQFSTKTNLTINGYPAVYTQEKIAGSTIDTYIISNQGIAVIINLTEKEGPGVEKAFPNGFDRTSYINDLSNIAHSIKFFNSAPASGLLPGANSSAGN